MLFKCSSMLWPAIKEWSISILIARVETRMLLKSLSLEDLPSTPHYFSIAEWSSLLILPKYHLDRIAEGPICLPPSHFGVHVCRCLVCLAPAQQNPLVRPYICFFRVAPICSKLYAGIGPKHLAQVITDVGRGGAGYVGQVAQDGFAINGSLAAGWFAITVRGGWTNLFFFLVNEAATVAGVRENGEARSPGDAIDKSPEINV